MKETLFKVAYELHSAVHVVIHGHERQLSSSMEPADQLIADVQQPSKCLEIISLAFDEIVECLAIVFWTVRRNDVQPFGQTNLLEALLHEREQPRPTTLLLRRQVQNDL